MPRTPDAAGAPSADGAGAPPSLPKRPSPPAAAAPGMLPPAVRMTRAFAVGSLLALIALGLTWELWLAPTGRGTLSLKVLPLLLPLSGLLRLRMFTYRWLSLFIWLYFIEGTVRATSDTGPGRWLALAEVLLCLLLFAACAAHVRLRLRQARRLA